VPLAAFKFAHGGPSIEEPPHAMGADTDAVLAELGYDGAAIARLRGARAI
jgi:crotonobetainyl-CoA:carnitine CoA-transferase CaiB-like acyl-CoA transferase